MGSERHVGSVNCYALNGVIHFDSVHALGNPIRRKIQVLSIWRPERVGVLCCDIGNLSHYLASQIHNEARVKPGQPHLFLRLKMWAA
jgi:hypothetical protein